jgi:hypothetical protein
LLVGDRLEHAQQVQIHIAQGRHTKIHGIDDQNILHEFDLFKVGT